MPLFPSTANDNFKSAYDALQQATDKHLDSGKKKKFEGVGVEGVSKITGEHIVKKEINHSKQKAKIQCMSWGPNDGDTRLAVVDQLGSCMVWNTVKGLRLYGMIEKFAQAVAISPDEANPKVLIGGMRNATTLYSKSEGSLLKPSKVWIKHDGYISSLHWLGIDKYISSSGDAEIRIFDINADNFGPSLQVFRGHDKDCQSIKFARDDKSKNVFITCSSDKTVKMWDQRNGGCVATFTTDSELNACTIFPDGKLIGCGGEKDKTYVFDVRSMRQVGKYARNNMKTASCEFSKSGRELFVGHDDGAIIVWDIFGSGENKSYLKKIEAHTVLSSDKKVKVTSSRVQALEVGPKGYLASGGFDGNVKIWGAPNA